MKKSCINICAVYENLNKGQKQYYARVLYAFEGFEYVEVAALNLIVVEQITEKELNLPKRHKRVIKEALVELKTSY